MAHCSFVFSPPDGSIDLKVLHIFFALRLYFINKALADVRQATRKCCEVF